LKVKAKAKLEQSVLEEQIRAALNAHWHASAIADANAEHDIYDDDAICDYPQSGERILGHVRPQGSSLSMRLQAALGGSVCRRAASNLISLKPDDFSRHLCVWASPNFLPAGCFLSHCWKCAESPMADAPNVFVVDDDPSVRSSLKLLISSVGLQVESFDSTEALLRRKLPDAPSCLVLDVRLRGLSGLDFQHELAVRDCHIPIIFITGHGDIPMSVRAMKAGAVEFLTKPFRDQDLLDAIRVALDRDRARREQDKEVADLRDRFNSLTPREQKVISMVVSGMLNKQIADQLGTAENTVKVQRSRAMEKMKAQSVPDLVRMLERLKVPSERGS
jgi:RNA polymerase sigma factor (sigma-70 family)